MTLTAYTLFQSRYWEVCREFSPAFHCVVAEHFQTALRVTIEDLRSLRSSDVYDALWMTASAEELEEAYRLAVFDLKLPEQHSHEGRFSGSVMWQHDRQISAISDNYALPIARIRSYASGKLYEASMLTNQLRRPSATEATFYLPEVVDSESKAQQALRAMMLRYLGFRLKPVQADSDAKNTPCALS